MHPRTLTQVNTAYFPCPPPNHTHTLTLIRIQNKQAAGTKTSKHFTESTKQKKKSTVYNSEKHHPSDTHRETNKYENQLETHGFSFIGRLPSSTISLPNGEVFFMPNCGEKHLKVVSPYPGCSGLFIRGVWENPFLQNTVYHKQAHLGRSVWVNTNRSLVNSLDDCESEGNSSGWVQGLKFPDCTKGECS